MGDAIFVGFEVEWRRVLGGGSGEVLEEEECGGDGRCGAHWGADVEAREWNVVARVGLTRGGLTAGLFWTVGFCIVRGLGWAGCDWAVMY